MKANIVDVSPPIPYLVLYFWAKMLTTDLQKSMGDEVGFLPADKDESFL